MCIHVSLHVLRLKFNVPVKGHVCTAMQRIRDPSGHLATTWFFIFRNRFLGLQENLCRVAMENLTRRPIHGRPGPGPGPRQGNPSSTVVGGCAWTSIFDPHTLKLSLIQLHAIRVCTRLYRLEPLVCGMVALGTDRHTSSHAQRHVYEHAHAHVDRQVRGMVCLCIDTDAHVSAHVNRQCDIPRYLCNDMSGSMSNHMIPHICLCV